jgi:hypothetical protein
MRLTCLAAPLAVAATLLAGAESAGANTPSYVTQIDQICASMPATPNITGSISATNIANAAKTATIFHSLIHKLDAVRVPQSASDFAAIDAWAKDVGKSYGYLIVAEKAAKAGNRNAYDTDLENAFKAAAAGKKASDQGGLTGC